MITSATVWRRVLLIAITTLVAALAVSFSKPDHAHAFVDPGMVQSSYVGWGYVRSTDTPAHTVLAYRWTGYSWTTARILEGTRVYIYPFSGDWMWIWTQRTDWLAITRNKLDTGARCPVGAYC